MWDNSNMQEDIQWGNIELPGVSDEELLNTTWSKSHKGDKLWIEKNSEKNKKLSKDSEWLKTTSEKNKKLSKDPKWVNANQEGVTKRKEKGQLLLEQGKINDYRKLFGVKDQHDKQTKEKMSKSACDRWAKTMKKVSALDKIYANIYEAAEALKVHKDTIVYRIKSHPDKYYYIT